MQVLLALAACNDKEGPRVLERFVRQARASHPPELVPVVLKRLEEGCDVVIASRYRRESARRP